MMTSTSSRARHKFGGDHLPQALGCMRSSAVKKAAPAILWKNAGGIIVAGQRSCDGRQTTRYRRWPRRPLDGAGPEEGRSVAAAPGRVASMAVWTAPMTSGSPSSKKYVLGTPMRSLQIRSQRGPVVGTGCVAALASRRSGPAITWSSMAVSVTVRAIGPA